MEEDTEDPDKEIIDLIVELKENQTQLVLIKSFLQLCKALQFFTGGF
jgi:hypothetical protein